MLAAGLRCLPSDRPLATIRHTRFTVRREMTTIRNYFRSVTCALLCAAFIACDRNEDAGGLAEDSVAAGPRAMATEGSFVPEPDHVILTPDRIYYTLTSYGWYARGEPLMHEGTPHQPDGRPVRTSLDMMEQAGTYQGVDYYRHRGGTEPLLYVPVFEGYWQPFRAGAAEPGS